MARFDPIEHGLKNGWQHIDASTLSTNQTYEADVVIVGSGAGGGVAAEVLTKAGLKVIIVEAGPLKSSNDFDMEERSAYPNLYQHAAAMKTKDKAIGLLQGQGVGGSTTINWTTCIRTPEPTLAFWEKEKAVTGLSTEALTPWFEKIERRLNIRQWQAEPNKNNQMLKQGCERLGWSATPIKRNVAGCINLGYCGMGCPTNAKQSMLVTTIPEALSKGAQLISRAKVIEIEHYKDKVYALKVQAFDPLLRPTPITMRIKARHFILAAGAIHTPSLMLKSRLADPFELIGKRTFLHPSVASGAIFQQRINAHSGAPQSIYSDQFVWQDGIAGELGYKLEVPPVHPVLLASKALGYGQSHADIMSYFNQLQVTLALIRDGFHEKSTGGQVHLTAKGSCLDYPLTPLIWRAARRAYASMAELQFAAGAKQVLPMFDGMGAFTSWKDAKQQIALMEFTAHKAMVVSAHIMGGCPMGEDRHMAMVNSQGRSHYYDNLSVMDGSIFPTSLGANPQLSIYAITAKNASLLAKSLTGNKADKHLHV